MEANKSPVFNKFYLKPAPKLRVLENTNENIVYFSVLHNFLSIGYYQGIFPFKFIHNHTTKTCNLTSGLVNKVRNKQDKKQSFVKNILHT